MAYDNDFLKYLIDKTNQDVVDRYNSNFDCILELREKLNQANIAIHRFEMKIIKLEEERETFKYPECFRLLAQALAETREAASRRDEISLQSLEEAMKDIDDILNGKYGEEL